MTKLLHGFLDRELDPARSLEVDRHLKECPACERSYQEQKSLRQVVASRATYFEAPPELSRRVRTALRDTVKAEAPPPRRSWTLGRLWLNLLVPTAAAALVLVFAVSGLVHSSNEERLAQEVISSHTRSLMANHLTDVASTDQHTVKPWFNGKVTFSPLVADPAAQGFPLIGGRLDVLQEQPVAALVYQRRKHFINLFIWPTTSSASTHEKFLAQRGYNLVHWTDSGMDYWAVSDVSRGDLQEFAQLVRTQASQPEVK